MTRPYSNDELIKLMDTAPLPVQQTIESKETVAIISGLGTRFGLHIDVIGKVAALNVQMLLGLVGPEEFLKELIAAGVSDKDARQIMTEINQKIFVPLREKMKSETVATPEPATPQSTKPAEPPKPVTPLPAASSVPTTNPKLLADEKLLEDHEEPSIIINQIKKTAPPPANLPGAMMPPSPPKPVSSVPPTPSKPYTVDPYREPIDEK
jgi:hypothetical protein